MSDYRNSSLCNADADGECSWRRCPQERDGEPGKSGRHCPLDRITPETHSLKEAEAEAAKWLGRKIRLRATGSSSARPTTAEGGQ